MSLAWHMAALSRARKFPRLKTLLVDERRPKRRQTAEEQMAILRAFTEGLKATARKR